jgi:hypothetical protein
VAVAAAVTPLLGMHLSDSYLAVAVVRSVPMKLMFSLVTYRMRFRPH